MRAYAFLARLFALTALCLAGVLLMPGPAQAGLLDDAWNEVTEQQGWHYRVESSTGEVQNVFVPDNLGPDFLYRVEDALLCDEPEFTCTRSSGRMDGDDVPEGWLVWDSGDGTFTATQFDGEHGSWALALYGYAFGSSCITCDFMAYFMAGLTDFSQAVYVFFLQLFTTLLPVMIAIWIGYRAAKLVTFGGEDGRAFIFSVAQKLALFAMLFIIFSHQVSTNDQPTADAPSEYYAWNTVGPHFLDYGFDLSNSLRASAVGTLDGNGLDTLACDEAGPVAMTEGMAPMMSQYPFILKGVEISCVTERTHIIGISTGLAVVFSSWNGASNVGIWNIGELPRLLLAGSVKIATGLLITSVYALSAVWLIFLTLDVVVRVMITAAIAPLLGGLYLWQPTRNMAVNGIRGMAGAVMNGVSLSIVSVLAFFLITNVVDVYEALRPAMVQQLADDENAYIIEPIKCELGSGDSDDPSTGDWPNNCKETLKDQFGEFIKRTQESDSSKARIPMDLATPWFYYMVLAGLAIFALGKKIIAILEGILQVQGMSAMADNAMKTFQAASKGAIGGGIGSAMIAKKGAGITGQGALFTAGTLYAGYKSRSVAEAGRYALNRFRQAREKRINPFANPRQGAVKSVLNKGVSHGAQAATRSAQTASDTAIDAGAEDAQ